MPQKANAQGCANPIICENTLPGDSGWDVSGSGDPSIQGFATNISVNVGGTVDFKVSTNARNYTLAIYRMGYYGGLGARKVATITPSAGLPQTQPACATNAATGLVDCGTWGISASWQVPISAVSGLYFARLLRADTGGASQIFFVVRNDSSHSDILYQTSDETWHAYNDYGGHSLYGAAGSFDLNNRAFKVSYNRPFDTRNFEAATFLFNGEYPMIRWLEANGYDVSYFTCVDAVRNANLIANHKVYLSVGHDEYVSKDRRNNLEAARDAGVNLAFFSGNEIFWKTRWENSIDGSNTPFRTLVCYKETYVGTGTLYVRDPADPPTWTGTWRDPNFSPPADGGRPENALSGTMFLVNGPGSDNSDLSIKVPAADGKMRFWRNTSIANQSPGQVATLPAGTLGYEWDTDLDNGFRPAGLIPLSTATYTMTADRLLDYGATYGAGDVTHHVTLYRASSGALVFGAGTVQWAWGLDSNHDGGGGAPDVRMQQATVNLFADMGAQPGTIQTGLVPAAKTSDLTPPTTAVTFPTAGSTVQYGSAITVTGTATDAGGGVVGAVEVSVDGGQTWHPANGREQWSYSWKPWAISGSASLMTRAADDSGNLSVPRSVTFTVAGTPTCPCSIWNTSTVPGTPSANDGSAVELGLKFRSDAAGFVTGVRFYKGVNNTGTHVGDLWTNNGAKLGSVTFTSETASGWQQATFPSPIPIAANTTYVISYYAPNGGYADDEPFFSSAGVDQPPLHALANGVDGGNGLFVYGAGGGFPINTFSAGNYWVDVVFKLSSSAWSISGTISGGAGATVALTGSGSATVSADSSGNYSFAGLANGSYTITPTKAGLSFSPASASVTVNGSNVTQVNFTATVVPTHSISGTIASGSGATVTLSGAANASVTANSSGAYTFTTVADGSYVVTPSEVGFTFAPASAPVTMNGANVSGVNFTATALPRHSVSGTIAGGGGATVDLGGSATATVTANASGNYVFTNLLDGSYTVTPSKTGFVFAPATQNVSVNGGDVSGVSFTGSQANSIWNDSTLPGTASANDVSPVELGLKFRSDVAGSVTGIRFYKGTNNTGTHVGDLWTSSGTKLATVTFTGETGSGWQQAVFSPSVPISANTTYVISYYAPNGGYAADANFFTSAGIDNLPLHALRNGVDGPNGVYVYASGGGFPSSTFNSTNYWVDVVFSPAGTWSISGTIAGGSGATVTLGGAATAAATADASGNYTFTGLANGAYTITPSKAGFSFAPASQNSPVSGANVTGVNFTATAVPTWSISGTIAGGSGASVALSGPATATTVADSSGNYTFTGLANGGYTITPSKTGFSFAPASQGSTVSGANMTGVNFTATTVPTWSISGTIAGGNGASVALSGAFTATATADSSGSYTFANMSNGAYTVTPSKTGFVFAPASRNVTVSGGDVSGVSFAGSQANSIWNDSTLPGTPSDSDTSAVELGLKFRSDVAGSITGIRFYKGTSNTGTHVGNLWTSTGTKLATVTFTGETGSGWQQAVFSPSVPISANTTYVVSYYAPNGGYAADANFFAAAGVDNAPLHALANGVDGGNGIFVYGTGGGFPSSTFNSANYWVDVVFSPAGTWSISGTIAGGSGATVTLGGAATAAATADASGNYTFTGLANGAYTITPSKAGFSFAPASQGSTVSGANVTGVNFTATAVPTWSISGTITGGSGASVALTGGATATTTADSSGNYTFTGLLNGTYTITPSKSGLGFTPATQSATVNGADVTGVSFAAKPGISIDAKISVDQDTASTTVKTSTFSTASGNELLLAFVATDYLTGTNTTVTSVTGAGLTWALVIRKNAQRGTSEIWRAFAPSALTGVTVTAALSQSVGSSMTVISFGGVDTSGTNGSGAIGATGTGSAASGAPTASLTTRRANSWVFGVGNDFDNPIARTAASGQSVVHQNLSSAGDTYWVQMQNSPTPASGTKVTMKDTAPTSDRYNFSLCEILQAP